MTHKTIAITGGSGHLGSHVILKLLDADYHVKALYRRVKPDISSPRLEWIQGDITSADGINALLKGCETVIHCAAIVTLTKTPRQEILETNAIGTQNIVDHCAMSNTPMRLIYISSTSVVNPKPIHEISNESRPYLNNSDYAYSWSKSMAEQVVVSAINDSNLDALILRPSALIGPPDSRPSLFGDFTCKFINNKFPVITTGGYNMVDIRDAAKTIVNSIEMGKKGEIYNIGGTYNTLYDITKLISKYSGSKLPKVVLSISMTIFFEPLIRLLFKARKMESPFSKENMYFVKNGTRKLDSSKAIDQLNHQCRPTEETMKDLVNWFMTKK